MTLNSISINHPQFSRIGDMLREHGVVVIENVFSGEECQNYVSGIFDCFEKLGTGIDRSKKKTWQEANLPPQTRPGLFQSIIGNLPPIWDIRTHDNVKKIFREVYSNLRGEEVTESPSSQFDGQTEFVVSSDGLNLKPAMEPFFDEKFKDWPHLDQTSGDVFKCVQGQAVLTTSTACFRASPKSHLVFEQLKQEFGLDENYGNWFRFSGEDQELVKRTVEEAGGSWQIPIRAKKGSFIIWLSSIIHSAQYGVRGEHATKGDYFSGWRCVVYVCYRPRNDFTIEELEERLRAYHMNLTTNHWSTEIFPTVRGGMSSNLYHKNIQELIKHPEKLVNLDIIPIDNPHSPLITVP